jgi:hypothetical protein
MMVLVTVALAVLALLVAAVVGVAALLLQRRVSTLQAQIEGLSAEAVSQGSTPALASPALEPGSRRLITVEILNPLEVAASQSRAARLLVGLTPAMITKIVYDQASAQILEGLEEEGVAAEVRVHVAD